ncbi:MAG: response regulator [Candidatus Thermoplasmatota archaeon]
MLSARRILIVEDNADEAKLARDVLADSGYVVFVAPSAHNARLAAVEEAPFDLVFMDFQLPDGDGLRLLPALRRAGVSAPVVLLTGDGSERLSQQAFSAGCADLAVKDLNYHLWLPRMAQALIPAGPGPEGAWGSHVLGLCVGRLRGNSLRAEPEGLWPPLAETLQALIDVAVKGVRWTGESLLGSLPVVHVQLPGRHLLFILRGGTFGAAVLAEAPTQEDQAELLALATAFPPTRRPDEVS